MKRNNSFFAFLILLLLPSLSFPMQAMASRRSEAEPALPPLIQTTTLEGDYHALIALQLLITPLTEQGDTSKTCENVRSSCVRIQVTGHHGSGSIYQMSEDEIIIATNRHVLQYWDEESYVTFFDGTVAEGKLLGVSEKKDVGFVSVSASDLAWETLLELRHIRAGMEPQTGDGYLMIDMAASVENPVMYTGEVISPSVFMEAFSTLMLFGEGEAKPGMSGCGIFDEFGNYVGMLAGGTDENEIAAVPAEAVEEAYAILMNRNE